MAKSTDWLPRTRELRVAMAKNWLSALQTKAQAWNIPATAAQDLTAKTTEAENWLEKDLSADRTKTITAQTKAAFDDLEAFMRDFKRRYFLVPPLADTDLVSLELKPQDRTPTTEADPTAQPEADLTFPGVHLVELKNIRPVGGAQPHDGSDCGARVYYGLTGTPTTKHKFRVEGVPTSGHDLPYSEWASKKKILLDFDGESGNTVYFCLQYENKKGKAGPFGPILKAVIP
jgi:hypothetical protein